MEGRSLSLLEKRYFIQCLNYWKNWQEHFNKKIIINSCKEYQRNCNRYILDDLEVKGYKNISKINININKDEFINRLISSSVKIEDIPKQFFLKQNYKVIDDLER